MTLLLFLQLSFHKMFPVLPELSREELSLHHLSHSQIFVLFCFVIFVLKVHFSFFYYFALFLECCIEKFLILYFNQSQTHRSSESSLRPSSTQAGIIFVWLTRSVIHTMPGPKIFIPGFVTVNRAPVTWFTIVKDRLQSTLG